MDSSAVALINGLMGWASDKQVPVSTGREAYSHKNPIPRVETYRRFREQHAAFYGVSPSTLYRVDRWSWSGGSAWLEMNGDLVCVPRIFLVDSGITDNGWRYTRDFGYSFDD